MPSGTVDGSTRANGTCRAERVACSNRAAKWVNNGGVELAFPDHCKRLGRERFVELYPANITGLKSCTLQGLWDCCNRTNSHDLWRYPSNSVRDKSGNRRESEGLDGRR